MKYPVIALRDIVVFPKMIATLFVGREKSLNALTKAVKDKSQVLVLCQKDPSLENPTATDLYQSGCLSHISEVITLPDGTIKALVHGKKRVKVKKLVQGELYFEATVDDLEDRVTSPVKIGELANDLINSFQMFAKTNKKIPAELIDSLTNDDLDEVQVMATMLSQLPLSIRERQELLELDSIDSRLDHLILYVQRELGNVQTEDKIRGRIKNQMSKSHREYYLNEQLKAIQRELGQSDEGLNEFDELDQRIKQTSLSKEAALKVTKELKKLKMMNPISAEAGVIRTYIDTILDLPWNKFSNSKVDIQKAKEILDEDHYGLDKIKERILDFLAVQKRMGKIKSQILCFVGPPGVGKTSLGQSISRAINRKFIRSALGGVHDESEIRGHRRTYIGSMPGKIIQGLRKVKTQNPVFLLDEIDKMSTDWRGDPASAMLEVLDPEQNENFNDHYLELDYDLSNVFFIATANSMNIPGPLLDRMEIIHLDGYTEEEKQEIAKRHLVKKQIERNGLKENEISISDDALLEIVQYYTREAGVRGLEREISSICRKSLRELMESKKSSIAVTKENLKNYIGLPKYTHGTTEEQDQVGICTGLSWSQVGGDMLMIEAVKIPGKGRIITTGKLGDVMQESMQAAFNYIRSKAEDFGIDRDVLEKHDIHVHVPEGATPKEGPSAGGAIFTTILSLLTNIPVSRHVAMTGEINLRGKICKIGGLKQKLLAATRGGIKTVLIPKDNVNDLEEMPDNVKQALTIIPVGHADEIIPYALTEDLKIKTSYRTKKAPMESGAILS